MDIRLNGLNSIGSLPLVGGGFIYDAAPTKETGSIQTFSGTGFRTDIRSADICSATQVENIAKNAGRTLSLRAPSK